MNKRTIFLTGATGCLGKELLRRFLLTTEDKVILLVRRKNRYSHWDRIRKILSGYGLERTLGTRVEVFEGDVSLPWMGLSQQNIAALTRQITEFYHVAALTALNGSEEECRLVNLMGTEMALKLAWKFREEGVLERYFYFSTAFVAGSLQTFTAKEDELPARPAHANFYESSKHASETKVREAMAAGLPATIFRPSIVVGDSKTGEVSEFNVIYPFMKLFAHGILSVLPTRLENSFNVVPIDYVIEASMAIARQKNSLGKTFHLVSKEPPTIGMLLRLKEEQYPNSPAIEISPPEKFKKENLSTNEQFAYDMLLPYLGYLNGGLSFDTSNTERALSGTGIESPRTDYAFMKTLVQYAVDAGYLVLA